MTQKMTKVIWFITPLIFLLKNKMMNIKITKKERLKLGLFYLIAFVITAFTYIVLIEGMSFSQIDTSKGLRVILIAAVGAIFPVVIS
jgi:hypothetical protein